MTYTPAKFEVSKSNGLVGDEFTLDQGHNFALYPLHHVNYTAVKFEVATSSGLG